MKTKVVALDVYGTFLSSEDAENAMPVRGDFEAFIKRCQKEQIKIVTASDSDLTMLKLDLEIPLKRAGLDLDIFDELYQLDYYPKDFSDIIQSKRQCTILCWLGIWYWKRF